MNHSEENNRDVVDSSVLSADAVQAEKKCPAYICWSGYTGKSSQVELIRACLRRIEGRLKEWATPEP